MGAHDKEIIVQGPAGDSAGMAKSSPSQGSVPTVPPDQSCPPCSLRLTIWHGSGIGAVIGTGNSLTHTFHDRDDRIYVHTR